MVYRGNETCDAIVKSKGHYSPSFTKFTHEIRHYKCIHFKLEEMLTRPRKTTRWKLTM